MLCRLPNNLHFNQMPPGMELGLITITGEMGNVGVLKICVRPS